MVKIHHRPGILIRWFHRCPECGTLGGLQVCGTERSISGVHTDYKCRKCGEKLQDWKPSDAVKF